MDRLWEQVRPLYVQLHAYVRWRLREKYGDQVVPASGPIPADLLGNLWAQSWESVYPLVAPPNADPGYDLYNTNPFTLEQGPPSATTIFPTVPSNGLLPIPSGTTVYGKPVQ